MRTNKLRKLQEHKVIMIGRLRIDQLQDMRHQ